MIDIVTAKILAAMIITAIRIQTTLKERVRAKNRLVPVKI
jgi:hypothetical protein